MKKISRYDVQKLDGYEVTPQGFLRIPVYAGRTGIQLYRRGDNEILKEYRPPEEVFSEKSMATLRSCPMTNNHPSSMVNVDNAKDLMCGFTVDHAQKVDNKFLKTYVVVYDKDAIELIKSGKREVSMGYDVELDFTPGEVDGQKYDAIQRNIVHNHIALVDRARGGREVRLRLDSEAAILVDENDNQEQETEMKIKIGDKEFDVAQDIADAFNAYSEEMNKKIKKGDEAEGELTKANEKIKGLEESSSKLSTDKDSLQAKVDALEADKAKGSTPKFDGAALEAAVKERRRIDKAAEKVLSEEELKKADSMSAMDLKKAVIKAECKDAALEGKSEAYIDARFDHIVEQLEVSKGANTKAGLALVNGRKKAGSEEKNDADKARDKAMEEAQSAWTKPLGKQAK